MADGDAPVIIIPDHMSVNTTYKSADACIADLAMKIYANNVNLQNKDAIPINEIADKAIQAAKYGYSVLGAGALVDG